MTEIQIKAVKQCCSCIRDEINYLHKLSPVTIHKIVKPKSTPNMLKQTKYGTRKVKVEEDWLQSSVLKFVRLNFSSREWFHTTTFWVNFSSKSTNRVSLISKGIGRLQTQKNNCQGLMKSVCSKCRKYCRLSHWVNHSNMQTELCVSWPNQLNYHAYKSKYYSAT